MSPWYTIHYRRISPLVESIVPPALPLYSTCLKPGSYRTNLALSRSLGHDHLVGIAIVVIAIATSPYTLDRRVSRRSGDLWLICFFSSFFSVSLVLSTGFMKK
ncbi:hypothetical protein F4678DRAFT_423828 [Xylaria arbuscula]|nr:hypothetical protein F4678DRAFT_423828 [Xylaria arbuscula]